MKKGTGAGVESTIALSRVSVFRLFNGPAVGHTSARKKLFLSCVAAFC